MADTNYDQASPQRTATLDTPLVKKWKDEARRKGRRRGKGESLLRILRARGLPLSDDLLERILLCKDPAVLDRWFGVAATAESPELIRQDVEQYEPGLRIVLGPTEIESPLVAAWKSEGWEEGLRQGYVEGVLLFLRARFAGFPKEAADSILACQDAKQAELWIIHATTAETLTQFRERTGL
jgi:hypothetical protein